MQMQNAYRTFIRTYNYILDFVIPRFCVGCHKEHEIFCNECARVVYQTWANCLLCDSRNMTGAFCEGSCKKQAPQILKNVYWVGRYDDTLKVAISQLKYRKRQELAKPLGALIAKKFSQYHNNFEPDHYRIVPIPLHPDRQKERGFNQAELIAITLSKITNIEVEKDFLKKVVNTSAQAKTSNRIERMDNLRDAFVAKTNDGSRTSIISKTIILVDDVATTGATLFHASKALSNAGVKNIVGIVVAHG